MPEHDKRGVELSTPKGPVGASNAGRAPASCSAARTDNAALRRELRDYVTAWMKHGGPVSSDKLARLVTDAPAFQTLDANEWWNVALILAFGIKDGAFDE